ncbi:MAG TPA: D-alanine--D-alanine ligase family protein [Candidatus Paceibacterota bacterium]|nr:D-alanine--D-alanine ligase family protein [Candidatus Paceibacterota bacterium]
MKRALHVAVLMGGKSAEHEVSLRSATNVIAGIRRLGHRVTAITVPKSGRISSAHLHVLFGRSVDVVFPLIHGPFGEDGTVQGMLKLADKPYVGPDVLGSAVGMDKETAKRLMADAGIPVAPFVVLRKGERHPSFTALISRLGSPVFIKPSALGSSVGVHKVSGAKELRRALNDAFLYDHKVLAEACIAGRELECSVLGNERLEASVPGEVVPRHDFYSYAAKYVDPDGAALVIPARLTASQRRRVCETAIAACRALSCEGMARVDFFLTPAGKLYVNEVNTIPGFTDISMYPKLWAASGLPYDTLIRRLLELAVARHRRDANLKTSYV